MKRSHAETVDPDVMMALEMELATLKKRAGHPYEASDPGRID